jgi:dCMP deaminase
MDDAREIRPQTELDLERLRLAFRIARQTDDPKTGSAVGALVVTKDEKTFSSANQVVPELRGKTDYKLKNPDSPERYFKIEHAERAAIFDALVAGAKLADATMYCTRFPCSACARAICWFGFARLVVAQGFSGETNWIDEQRVANAMLRDAGVTIRYLSPE